MKTTLTLEDVERLEKEIQFYPYEEFYSEMQALLPLILPVIREYVRGNPEGLRPPVQASLGQGTDAPPSQEAMWTCETCGGVFMAGQSHFCPGPSWRGPTWRKVSVHHGSHPACSQSKAAASLKTAPEGSVCEVEASSPPSSEDTELLDWLETQSKVSSTGISFDYVRYVEDGQVIEKGYRFMRRHFLGERKDTLRAAIRAARVKEVQQASTTPQKGGQGV